MRVCSISGVRNAVSESNRFSDAGANQGPTIPKQPCANPDEHGYPHGPSSGIQTQTANRQPATARQRDPQVVYFLDTPGQVARGQPWWLVW